jgi:autotransporter passenger strand-loop-strand repeat protein
MATLVVSSGQTSTGLVVSGGNKLQVLSGGGAHDIDVFSGGLEVVSPGGRVGDFPIQDVALCWLSEVLFGGHDACLSPCFAAVRS